MFFPDDFGNGVGTRNRSEVKNCGRKKNKEKSWQEKEVVCSTFN
jgi:hypothetical protein